MHIRYRYQKNIVWITVVSVLLITTTIGIYFRFFHSKGKMKQENKIVLLPKQEQIEPDLNQKKVQIDIKGQVFQPGIYEVEEGKRVMDVIQLAGGLTEIGDTSVLNLSKKVVDEMVIVVYSK